MTTYALEESEFQALKGKTILITGCATGIGRETAKIAHQHGANLALLDWNEVAIGTLIDELGSDERVIFRKTDVAVFDDVLEGFQATGKRFGVIHAVLSNAGVNFGETLLQDDVDDQTGKLKAPNLKNLDINLIGQMYVVKCAVHYFQKWPEVQTQIVMTASAASFIDTPPLYLYCAAKAGIVGLMRGLRTQLVKKNITINAVCPWMTITPMLPQAIIDIWGELPANQTSGIAHALLLPVMRPNLNGKSLFVAGHQIVDFEDSLHESQPLWMGKQLSADVDEGQKRLIPLASGWNP